jgi:hypothetical protein
VAQQSGPRAKQVTASGGGSAGYMERQCLRGQNPALTPTRCDCLSSGIRMERFLSLMGNEVAR